VDGSLHGTVLSCFAIAGIIDLRGLISVAAIVHDTISFCLTDGRRGRGSEQYCASFLRIPVALDGKKPPDVYLAKR